MSPVRIRYSPPVFYCSDDPLERFCADHDWAGEVVWRLELSECGILAGMHQRDAIPVRFRDGPSADAGGTSFYTIPVRGGLAVRVGTDRNASAGSAPIPVKSQRYRHF
jgi:hypothetical protein